MKNDCSTNPDDLFSKKEKTVLVSQGLGRYVMDQTTGVVRFELIVKEKGE